MAKLQSSWKVSPTAVQIKVARATITHLDIDWKARGPEAQADLDSKFRKMIAGVETFHRRSPIVLEAREATFIPHLNAPMKVLPPSANRPGQSDFHH
ncbi:hypothetical protein DFP72DRAFT_1081840 [Ephemerocybe angulata]|uniref:Uncharacterized protein n=1 Tax=Ephemerocybe angulata TaxID=980116 RepID=A0A8H6LVC9_9AGAR|nr:hypothetical protein DFP72DRAFT_1081840 [Tulosesus angulatus]